MPDRSLEGSCIGGVPSEARELNLMNDTTHTTACPDCHALTDDLAAHERWHTRLVQDLATAVARETDRQVGQASG